MKKTLILISTLLLLNLQAEVILGDTSRQYSKPGAPIDMKFISQKVDINESADINISLKTTVNKGTFFAVITLDDELEKLNNAEQNLSFIISENQQDFLIDLEVSAKKAGLYYIRLLTKVTNNYGTKLRSFAVPVYIGEQKKKILPKGITSSFKALGTGENISISKAVETIKLLKTNNQRLK